MGWDCEVRPSVVAADADTCLFSNMIANGGQCAVQSDDVGAGGGGYLQLVNLGVRIVAQIPVDGDEDVVVIVLGMQSRDEETQYRQHDNGEERAQTDLGGVSVCGCVHGESMK